MSKSFTKLFIANMKFMLFTNNKYEFINNKPKILFNSCLTLIGSGTHLLYVVTSKEYNNIKITDKYQMVRHGFTDFMVIDDQGRHFNVNNSFWFWKWNSIEDWNKIAIGDNISVKYYGWRVPLFGIFPNIYELNKIK